VQTASK